MNLKHADVDVIRRAAIGDAEAFSQLYRRYLPIVYRFCRATTGSSAAAEDLAQETFVTLLTELARYDPARASFTTYLYGIVRNLSRQRFTREQRFLPLEVPGIHDDRTSYEADPGAAIDGAQLAGSVRRALSRLPIEYRGAIILCDVQGLSYAEAARVIGTSVAAVRWRLHRGRHVLRLRLRDVAGRGWHRAFNS